MQKFTSYIIIFVGLLFGSLNIFVFAAPPSGCTPASCPNGPLVQLKAENISAGVVVGGITGTLNPSLPDCVSTAEINCKTTTSFVGVDTTELAAQLCSDVIFAGVTGTKTCSTVVIQTLSTGFILEPGVPYTGEVITAEDAITVEMWNYAIAQAAL